MRTAMLFSFVSFLGLFALSCKKEKKQNPIHHYRKAKELYEKKTPKALKEARKHLKISCEGKIGAACFNLGMLFHKGEGGKKDPEKALALFEKACTLRESKGCYNTGIWYAERKEFKSASDAYYKGCELKSGMSCNKLGVLYQSGDLGENDFAEAVKWYRAGCERKFPRACYNLANVLNSKKLPGGRKAEEALGMFKKACELGFAKGCASVGYYKIMHHKTDGKGLQGIATLKKTCETIPESCYMLSVIYEKGVVVPKDDKESKRYAKKACDLGLKTACFK